MKFKIRKASDWKYKSELEINTLEELINFVEENGEIILDEDEIMIYDDYIE
jgi:hypothetical protein